MLCYTSYVCAKLGGMEKLGKRKIGDSVSAFPGGTLSITGGRNIRGGERKKI
jgi:hypothetical protein